MSGIVGTLDLDGAPARSSVLWRMLGTIAHRGPDGLSVWTDGAVGLGHVAHWTTPEAEAEPWPLVRPASGIVLVADARIDNRADVLRVLDPTPNDEGVVTDAALIAAAYERWGLDCPVHLIGDFAFAIWDEREQRLFCVRDGVGTRPLFYAHNPGRNVAVGSEIKALLAHPEVGRAVREESIADYLTGDISDPESTFYRDVRRLLPGHALTVTPDGLRTWQYWTLDPDREVHYATDEAYADAFREHFEEAVRCRLRSNQPVGAFLSGGLDSSSIAGTARTLLHQRGGGSLPTFSTIYDRFPTCDERDYMHAVLDPGGYEPHFFRADDVDRLPHLESMLDVHDEPFFAPNLATRWAALPHVRATGTRVLLDGHGGDEAVSQGYGRLQSLARAGEWRTLAGEVWAGTALRGGDLPPGLWRTLAWHYGVAPWMDARPWAQRLYGWWRQLCTHATRWRGFDAPEASVPASLLRAPVRKRLGIDAAQRRQEQRRARPHHSNRRLHYLDLTAPMQGRALEILDRTAAHRGVELRFPFLDRRLLEFCLALPADQKRRHGWGRYVLRRALEDRLPEIICRRRSKADFSPHLATGLMREKMTLDALLLNSGSQAFTYINPSEVERLVEVLDTRGPETPGPVLFELWRCAVLTQWMQLRTSTSTSSAREGHRSHAAPL